jgi:hypothetical protein
VNSPPSECFTRGPRNVSRVHTKASSTRRAGKELVPEYDSDSDTAPGSASDSNPLFGFYSDSAYEFDFGSDPEDPESEDNSTEKSSTAGENDGFPAFSARLCNLLLPEKFKPLEITKYDVKQDPVQWLRCYALSIENAGGNNDTKCLYFPFCLDQAPLTWFESLEKYSIDNWD